MTRYMREHRTPVHLLPAESFAEIDAIDDMIIGSLDVQHFQNGGVQVSGLNAYITSRSGLGDTGPDNNGRDTDASFMNATFSASQRMVACDGRDVFSA